MIRHIVALKFPGTLPQAQKQALFDDLAGLQALIDGTLDFRSFANVSPETAVVHGFHDLFWFDFRDETARDAYLVHPTHQAIGARLVAATEGGVAGVLVCDVML